MQGIVRYVHQKSGDIVKYRVSTDVEEDKERFEDRKQNADEEHRAEYIKGLVFEVVEITDNLNERYGYYGYYAKTIFNKTYFNKSSLMTQGGRS